MMKNVDKKCIAFLLFMHLLVLCPLYMLLIENYVCFILFIIIVNISIAVYLDKYDKMIDNPLTLYEPAYLVGKYFMYGEQKYIIVEYVSYGQDDLSCFFKCRTCAPVNDEVTWYECELKKSIESGEIEIEV